MRQKISSILLRRNNKEKRIIAHIDMNSYFATVEQQARPSLRGKPIGVSGKNDSRSIVAAASVEAKKRGVKTAMSIPMARRICPEIIIVPGDMARYEYVTKKFIKIFINYTPEVEIFSVDEAFLELSHSLGRHAEFISASDRQNKKILNQVQDDGYQGARKIAIEIKQRIKQEIGEWITCSVGIGPNKMIAKLASDKQKPDGLVVVKPQEVKKFMKTVELTDICGIASRIERRLNMLSIRTTRDLANFSQKILIYEFGLYGHLLKMWGRGEDPSPIIPYYLEEKPRSIGHSYTLPKDTYDPREIRRYLYLIADKVGRRTRKQNYAGRVINLYIRFYDFTGLYKVKTIQYPVSDSYEIYKICRTILESIEYLKAVRMIGVSLSGLIKKENTTRSLIPLRQKIEKSLFAQDKINNRYGEMVITRAEFLNFDLKERVGGFLSKENLEIK
ncbi:MAG: DNA polymerase IV [candidate division Zixibacteria bacterium]|nr:DNA polymerase IV [candidate division Zixibacteria bacterium]